MAKENTFTITFNRFYQGFSPIAASNSLTSFGNAGHASSMTNADVLNADYIVQGPGLATLTNGTEAGNVKELINFIMDKAVSADLTYGIGVTKIYPISSTSVGTPTTVTDCTDGESCINLKGNLYYFYNKTSGGEIGIFDLATTFDHDWGSTVPTGKAALQKAIHPVASKEDLMLFGNGRYTGVYTVATTTLEPTKLDFGNGHEVADVIFHANQWWIAVNSGVSGTNRNLSSIYLYDGSATTSLLSDETSVGVQRIGFLYPLNGIIYVAYQDLSSTAGYKIGYIAGRQLKPLGYFSGSLPTFAQKTLYKNTILFVSGSSIYSAGAVIEELPIQTSQIMDGGYSTVGAIACPFGTPMISSTQSTSYKLAQASGYDTTCDWKSIIVPLVNGRNIGYVDEVTVLTNTLGAAAQCDLILEYNQDSSESATKEITGENTRRHIFPVGSGTVEDLRVYLNWENGSTATPTAIREIQVKCHWVEK